MCAIAGVIGMDCSDALTAIMQKTMQRRGPDQQGVYRDRDCTLLHARLAIVDPDGGRQPMELPWAGEEYCIVYNGELYNTAEIRRELERCGHVFLNHSDTAVVLHAYAQWGEACLDKLNGIFAFAVWESRKRRLFLARDRIGVKPLFYMEHRRGVLFASEMKTILSYPTVVPELDEDGAAQILLLGPGRKPGSGVLRNMFELEPGEYALYQDGHMKKHRYWRLTDREHTESFEETAEKTRSLVIDAIRRQMVSDVPLGTFLSGGLDSSIISAVCAEEMRKKGDKLPTFSVDYLNNDMYFKPGKFQPNSDNAFIAIMQDAIQSEHHWTVLTADELSEALEEATTARDLPGMADVDFSLLAFCKQIRTQVKVALSGECADEIFGGYPWFRDPAVREQEGFPWAQTTPQRAALLSDTLIHRIQPAEYVMDAYQQTCAQSDILPGTPPLERRMKQMVNLNFRWFMQTLLDRKDRMSMYSGLEVRVPFCDYRIAEYLYGVPWSMKDYQGREKGLLRYAVQGLLPSAVLTRKKSPYPKTFDPRYEKLMSEKLSAILTDPQSPLFHLIRKESLEEYLYKNSQWPWYGQLMRRPQTMAYFVQIDFWLRKYGVQLRF